MELNSALKTNEIKIFFSQMDGLRMHMFKRSQTISKEKHACFPLYVKHRH